MKNKSFYSFGLSIAFIFYLFTGSNLVQAQTNPYYYYKGQRINLAKSWSKVYITGTLAQSLNSLPPSIGLVKFTGFDLTIPQPCNWAVIEFSGTINTEEAYMTRVQQLTQSTAGIATLSPFVMSDKVLEPGGGTVSNNSVGISHLFHVKLKQLSDSVLIQQKAANEGVILVQRNPFMPLWFTLACDSQTIGNALQKCNTFWETGDYADVDPAFMFDFRPNCTNDPNFGSLWGLYNSNDTTADIDACKAWNITRGAGVKVAVIDRGIELTHTDLAANISPSSYDAPSNSSPSKVYGEHGTRVAGIIGAVRDNNIQVVGVAPESTLMSISDTLSFSPALPIRLANGLNWAWKNGAQVINNSWGDQGGAYYDSLHSSLLENAITNALDSGRNGKGSVVVFASGNTGIGGPGIDYPGNFHPDILLVGASDIYGSKSYITEQAPS